MRDHLEASSNFNNTGFPQIVSLDQGLDVVGLAEREKSRLSPSYPRILQMPFNLGPGILWNYYSSWLRTKFGQCPQTSVQNFT